MDIHAAILWEQGQPLSVEAAELDAPGPGEVLVELKAAGVCHSDLHPARGDWPAKTPLVLGHEGAGIVREVGASVTSVKPGDHVVLCWAPACGLCPPCREGRAVLCDRVEKVTFRNKLPSGEARLHARQQDVAPFLGTACFSDCVVVPEGGAIRVPSDVSFEALATIGCAVMTGVGAVTNAGQVPQGARVVVIGTGLRTDASTGYGDPSPVHDVPAAVRELTAGRGADFVFDTVGSPATLTTALASVRKGGTVVLTGLSRLDGQGSIAMFPFVMQEKRLIGSVYGSGNPARDIPRLVSLYQEGQLKLNELVSRRYALDRINDALTALAASDGARGVILW